MPVGVKGGDRHAIGVERQDGQRSQHDILLGECDLPGPSECDVARCAHRVDAPLHLIGFDLFGPVAFESEQHRGERSVSGAGRRQRSEKVDADVGDVVECAQCMHVGDEPGRGPHRPDGMGARRADPDGEEIEHADRHVGTASFPSVRLSDELKT